MALVEGTDREAVLDGLAAPKKCNRIAVRAGAPDADEAKGAQALGGLARLLREAPYREAVLEGLAASVGGLDGSLASSAAAALGEALRNAGDGALPRPGPSGTQGLTLAVIDVA